MASSTPNTIILFVNGAERQIVDKLVAATSTIKPGMLVEMSSATQVTPVASASKVNTRMVAIEAAWADDVTAKAIDQAYDSADNVRVIYAQPGDLLYMWLAPSQTAVIGSVLASSTTAGALLVDATNKGHDVVGVAEEAVTTTGSSARIKVRIL